MSLTAVWACGRVCLLLVGYMQSLQRNDAVTRELGDLAVRSYLLPTSLALHVAASPTSISRTTTGRHCLACRVVIPPVPSRPV